LFRNTEFFLSDPLSTRQFPLAEEDKKEQNELWEHTLQIEKTWAQARKHTDLTRDCLPPHVSGSNSEQFSQDPG
jgi:hypothetical protein